MTMTSPETIRRYDFQTVLADASARYGEQAYLRFGEAVWSFAEADRISNRLGNGLLELGIKPGDHVALLLDNCPEIIWYYFALGKIGAVAVPINTAARGELLARTLRQSRATCLVVESALAGRARPALEACGEVRLCILVAGADGTADLPPTVDIAMHADVMKGADHVPPITPHFTDIAYLSFTSGTSGPSKANIATHAHTFAMAGAVGRAFAYERGEVLYICLPLYHGNAMRTLFVALMRGCTIALARKFSASSFWDDVTRFGATQFNLLGAMANMLWQLPSRPEERGEQPRKCMIVPMPRFAPEFADRFNLAMYSTYALTDFGYFTFLTPADPQDKWQSAGRPQPDLEVAILDDDDFPAAQGQPGEICARPRLPWVAAQGYFEMPEATVAAWRNLWFHTGDRGFIDADGYLFFVDRKKDSIRRRGENISAHEIEQIIAQHPAVREVAAFALDSDMSEDEVMVSIVLREDHALDEGSLVRWCGEQMAAFMVPRFVEFIEALPRTPTEKIEKYRLREAANANRARLWDRERAGIRIAR